MPNYSMVAMHLLTTPVLWAFFLLRFLLKVLVKGVIAAYRIRWPEVPPEPEDPEPEVRRCHGITREGKRCRKRLKKGITEAFCYYHRNKSAGSTDTEIGNQCSSEELSLIHLGCLPPKCAKYAKRRCYGRTTAGRACRNPRMRDGNELYCRHHGDHHTSGQRSRGKISLPGTDGLGIDINYNGILFLRLTNPDRMVASRPILRRSS